VWHARFWFLKIMSSVGPARPTASDYAAPGDDSSEDKSKPSRNVGPSKPIVASKKSSTTSPTTTTTTTSTTNKSVGPKAPTGPRKSIEKPKSGKDPYAGVRVGKLTFKNVSHTEIAVELVFSIEKNVSIVF
jgi:hypothetical protein